jgi:hypothetical protein
MWGYDDVGSSPIPSEPTYRGTGPFSEPENQAMRDFIESRAFTIALNYHSYGNLLLYPWGYAKIYTPDQIYLAAIADSATSFNGYDPSPGWGLYPTNGDADDWAYGDETAKPPVFAFTPEVGSFSDYFWPSPSRILPLCAENLPVNLLMAQIADNPRRLGPPYPATMLVSSPVFTDPFTVRWTQDPYNPGDNFELVEMTGKSTIWDGAESGSGNWEFDGFALSGARTYSGAASFYSGSGDNLLVSMASLERTEVASSDTLSMWCWYDIESNWDYAYVQASADGGTTYYNLAGNITTDYNPKNRNKGEGITGSSGGWVEGRFPLNSYSGEGVLIRVVYDTDTSVTGEGIYCDDIGPLDTFANSTVLSSAIPDTSYIVSGRSPGTYYYKVRGRDAEGQWSQFSNWEEVEVNQPTIPAFAPAGLLAATAGLILAALILRRRRSRAQSKIAPLGRRSPRATAR